MYRFTGSFRKTSAAPLVLTERVLGREGDVLTLELVLEDGPKKETLRIRKDATPGAADEVLEVTRVEADVTRSATVDAYEAMMAKTILAADQNEEQLGIETTRVRVGGKSLPCKKTSYRVRVGTHEATMSTVESDAFPWGDVAGEITTLDGKVLYRVEVVDAGNAGRQRDVAAVTAAR
ncbi:MAG: putative secreted protein [Labilithrix sp.]|nr:putative secreted protein [Labilithrix sp.]